MLTTIVKCTEDDCDHLKINSDLLTQIGNSRLKFVKYIVIILNYLFRIFVFTKTDLSDNRNTHLNQFVPLFDDIKKAQHKFTFVFY